MPRFVSVCVTLAALSAAIATFGVRAASTDIVLYAADIDLVSGLWSHAGAPEAADGVMLTTADTGWSSTNAPLASPAHYFEVSFDAPAGTAYQLWLRLRGADDSKWNESVWVQFDGAIDANGQPLWPIGSTSALLVNLENCGGCGMSGWGWQDNAWWLGQSARVRFASSGRQTMRVQVREDGVSVDQIVLSSSTWFASAPGTLRDDITIVPKPSPATSITMVREPYVQHVTSGSAVVVWATRENGAAEVRSVTGGVAASTPASSRVVPATVTGLGFDYYQHEARLSGLSPSTSYTYTPLVDGIALSSGDTFVTAPPTGTGTVRFIAFGDSGIGSTAQRQLASLMTGDTFDFALHTGDVVYGSEATTGAGDYPQLQSWFFEIYRDWLRTRPMFLSIGNHDEEANRAAPYRDVFVLPENGASAAYPEHAERFYSFDYGPAHVVVLDTELAFQNATRREVQLEWLRNDLASSSQPWKLAVFHRSPYSAGGEHGSDVAVRAAFSPVFDAYGVSLVLSGHQHMYERTLPIRETADGWPTVYVVTGGGGARLYPAGSTWWTAASASVYHYVRGTIDSCQIAIEAVDLEGDVFDATTLDRCASPGTGGATPYGGVAAAIPGTVQAEHFDEGGAGVAYLDSSAGNSGNEFRATDVDVQTTTDSGGGYNVGWMSAGEWLSYSVDVASAGTFALEARVASNGQGGTFHVEANGIDVTGPLTIPNTGGWQKWTTITRTGIALNAGPQPLRVVLDANSASGVFGNLNYLRVTSGSGTAFGGSPATVPGIVEAERFNEGGEGIGYHDTTAGNTGGQFRPSADVDVEITTDTSGGYNIGWISAGEWLAYAIDVAATGTYAIEARVAANGQGGTFHIEIDGADVTGPLTIPDTGGWQKWTTLSVPGVVLPGGPHAMRVVFTATGPTGVVGNLNHVRIATP